MPDGGRAALVTAASRLRDELTELLPGDPIGSGLPVSDVEDAAALVGELLDALLHALKARPDARGALLEPLRRTSHLEERLQQAVRSAHARDAGDLARGVGEAQACRTSAELAHRTALIALRACGATIATTGLIERGAWRGLNTAELADGGTFRPLDDVTVDLSRLSIERGAALGGKTVRAPARPGSSLAPMTVPCLVVPVPIGGRVRGLLHLAYANDRITREVVARADGYAHAVGHVFEVLDMHEQLAGLSRTVHRLRATLGDDLADDSGGDALLARGGLGAQGRGAGNAPDGSDPLVAPLTPRQEQTLELMLQGLSNAQIAERLVVSVPTVKSHVSAILRAVGAVNRAEAIGLFLERMGTQGRR